MAKIGHGLLFTSRWLGKTFRFNRRSKLQDGTRAMKDMRAITELLVRWRTGDGGALNDLTPLIYDDLMAVAKSRLHREEFAQTLEPSALVHEIFLQLSRQTVLVAKDRAHFYAIAAIAMKRVLMDHARKRSAQKRGSGNKVTLHPGLLARDEPALDLLALNAALEKLAQFDPRKARVIEQKYFGGLANEEIGMVEDISLATVGRELRFAQAWLRRELCGTGREE